MTTSPPASPRDPAHRLPAKHDPRTGPVRQPPGPQLSAHHVAPRPFEVLPDAVALDPARLQMWSAQQRWQPACSSVDPRLPADPHYPVLAAALDRLDAAGVDVGAALAHVLADGLLPDRNTGRALHFRLAATCEVAVTPAPPPAAEAPGTAPTAGPPPRRGAVPSRRGARR